MRLPLDERFWARVDRAGDGCWLWKGKSNGRYGRIAAADGRLMVAHRVSYELNVGPIPDGMSVLHRCDVTRCVRPDHLFIGTTTDNMRDAAAKGRFLMQRDPTYLVRMGRHGMRLHPDRVPRGERAGTAKVTAEQVVALRREYAAGGISVKSLAQRAGLTYMPMYMLLNGQHWAHVPGAVVMRDRSARYR